MTEQTDAPHTCRMPSTRMDELYALAEMRDGLLTSQEARAAGIADSVLVRLAQRGRLERVSRGVYRISHYPADRLAQYREAVLWAQASGGPASVLISHETALLLYGISDVNPARIHITVPVTARLRRERPKWITIHHAGITPGEINEYEGIPVTSVERTIVDVLQSTKRVDVARQAIADATKKGLLKPADAKGLNTMANKWAHGVTKQASTRSSSAS
ncbi:type IV toxin-antitoxin system AbiEi family antitoxin domain-containing protein [Edaphobacter dinghuensis]|nr:type IV toxin-antitoxin system AbiEi family antitoxin domain-containing protein [Edaphobacter dinghuensis]